MNGPAHYAKAEELLVQLEEKRGHAPDAAEQVLALRALAHATLAGAAATALGTSPAEGRAWAEVAGTKLGG